jgi:hypothetical protein
MFAHRHKPSARWIAALAAFLATAGIGVSARADFISGFVGNTQMSDFVGPTAQVSGVISFAVYDNSLGDFSTVTGLGAFSSLAGSPSLSAPFIYIYQMANVDAAAESNRLSSFSVDNSNGNFSGMGYFTNTVFNDGSTVGLGANPALGTEPVADDSVDGSPSSLYAGVVGFDQLGAAVEPNGGTLNDGSGFAVFEWLPPQVGEAATSSLLFLTSSLGPRYAEGLIADGNTTTPNNFVSNGDVPSATPEPATLALILAGSPLAAIWAVRRRRANASLV